MLHGFTFEKNGSFFTRITGFDEKTATKLTEQNIRYDKNQIHGNAMFLHLTVTEYEHFYTKNDIIQIDSLEEFKLIAKLMY